jgi:hypothetical protein
MIEFRCWYCNKRYRMAEERVGEQFNCSCQSRLRVPRRSGGRCRVKSLSDWLVEAVVYGGGGALLGFGLAALILSQVAGRSGAGADVGARGWPVFAALTLLGFVAGTLGGERGMTWIGEMIRGQENK